MATYRYTNPGSASLQLNDRPLYGSSRLGTLSEEMELHSLLNWDPADPVVVDQVDLNYELTDHLGNVCAVVSGRLMDGNGGGTLKQAELMSAQGYEPFGAPLPGRNYSNGPYRYLFQGQEHDNEINDGTSYAFEYRMHDPRIGRFWSIDPLTAKYPWNSPYSFAENKVIEFNELEGLETARRDSYFASGDIQIQVTMERDVPQPQHNITLLPPPQSKEEQMESSILQFNSNRRAGSIGIPDADRIRSANADALAEGLGVADAMRVAFGVDSKGSVAAKDRWKSAGWLVLSIVPGDDLLKPVVRAFDKSLPAFKGAMKFASGKLEPHAKHLIEYGLENTPEGLKKYEQMASDFFKREGKGIVRYQRKSGDIVQYDFNTSTFGVAQEDGTIRTMFQPKWTSGTEAANEYFFSEAARDLGTEAANAIRAAAK